MGYYCVEWYLCVADSLSLESLFRATEASTPAEVHGSISGSVSVCVGRGTPAAPLQAQVSVLTRWRVCGARQQGVSCLLSG